MSEDLTLKARNIARGLTYNDDQPQAAAKHMLLELANRLDMLDARKTAARIEALEQEIANCTDDFNYLITITENKDGLHGWLRMRRSRLAAMLSTSQRVQRVQQQEG